jgi:probable F420-dependent oxidoreductase
VRYAAGALRWAATVAAVCDLAWLVREDDGDAGGAGWNMRFSITTFVTDESIAPGPLAAAVEERGFHALIVTEHSHMPLAYEPPYPGAGDPPREFYRTLDPFVALASAAATTRTLTLTTGVILMAQRDVIQTAKEVATLDLVSNGRVVLGVGVGWNRHEMRHHGLDPATRGAKLNEQIRALKQIWTQDTAEFHGDFVDFAPIYSWPKPVQRPHPPIYVGGTSTAALRRLCTLGDGWLPPALPADKVLGARRWLAANGRPDVPTTIYGVGRDKESLASYAHADVDEVAFLLPSCSEPAALRELDELAELIARLDS